MPYGMTDLHYRLLERSQRLHTLIHAVLPAYKYDLWENCQHEPCKGDREALKEVTPS